jgi:uncharacterized phiE125 gp8 family phage protein
MLSSAPLEAGAEALAEAKAYLRAEGAGEDALIARLLGSAAELCEQFIGQALIRRAFEDVIPAASAWTRLGAGPVSAVTGVESAPVTGTPEPLGSDLYAIDVDAMGDGWVRLTAPRTGRVRVRFEAGMAAEWTGLPEAVRHGIIHLAAHLYTRRDGPNEAPPPAAVAALWRPWRRLRIG